MGNGLLAFAAGLGSGYLSANQRQQTLERQAKLDAMAQESHDAQMTTLNQEQDQKRQLAAAGKLATVDNGATLGLADGTNIAYSDPGVANSDFRQLRSADQTTGNQTLARTPLVVPPLPSSVGLSDQTQSPVDPQQPNPAEVPVNNQSAVVAKTPSLADGTMPQTGSPSAYTAPPGLADGTMPQAPQSSAVVNGKAYGSNFTGAQTAADAFNAGRAKRISDALYATGNPTGAMSMEANAQQATLNGLKVTQAQVDASREKANGIIMEQVQANGGDVAKTVAQVLTKTNAAGLAGTNVDAVTDPATNTVKLVATKPDGTKQVLKEYPTGPYGQAWMLHDLSQASFKDTQTFLQETGKAMAETGKVAAQTAFEIRKQNEVERHNAETEKAGAQKTQMEFDPLGLNKPPPGTGSNGTAATSQTSGTGNNGTGTTAQAIASGANGPDMLKAIPGPLANQVKALAEGRLAFPSGFALKTPYWQSMLTLVGQYDPSFDAINYQKRSQTANAFSKGVQGNAVRAVNQTLTHMGTLDSAINALDNVSSLGVLNRPVNSVINYAGEKGNSPTQGNFKQTVQAVASELRKVFSSGGVGNLQELKQWEDTMPLNASKDQQQAYLKNATKLLQGAMGALDNQYRAGLGPKASINDLITPEARAVLNKLTGAGPAASSGAQTGVQPQGSRGPVQKPTVAQTKAPLTDIEAEMQRRGLIK